jgi:hypothetical protein
MPERKVMRVSLFLRVENNSKFVRGKKKARQAIERWVLSHYQMEKHDATSEEYLLSIPYQTDQELARIMHRAPISTAIVVFKVLARDVGRNPRRHRSSVRSRQRESWPGARPRADPLPQQPGRLLAPTLSPT